MTTRSILRIAELLILISTVAFVMPSLAQDTSAHHSRYRLVQIGTFGGPNSIYNVFSLIAANDGTVVGAANTSVPDPHTPCFDDPVCFVQHAWKWHDGQFVDLGVLPGGRSSYTNAVNTGGLVVGQSEDGGLDPLTGNARFVATLWDHGQVQNLGTFGGNSIAIAISSRNFVMGAAENGVPDTSGFPGFDSVSQIRAFGWDGADIFDLGTLGGTGAFPSAMNNRGQVVGLSPTSPVPGPLGLPIDAFLWSAGKMHDLGTLGGTFGAANAINDRGQVVGLSTVPDDVAAHAFSWANGTMTDLGTLGGTFSNANWLNDAGEVIGRATICGDSALHAFVWRHGVISDLGTVGTDNASNAFGINNKGQVVGQSWFFDGENTTASHAFVWENGGPIVDLNALIANPTDLYLTEANFITDRGWIIARGLLPNGDVRTAILIPDGDADDLNLDSTPVENSQAILKPAPPQPQKLNSFKKQWLPSDYHSKTLARQSIQLHRDLRFQ